MKIVIANRQWSGPSLRGWLMLKRTGAPFTESKVEITAVDGRTFTKEEKIAFKARQAAASPTALMPVLHDGDLMVWDTAAIGEYLNDRFPDAWLWPRDIVARTMARSVAGEIHGDFVAFRRECRTDLFLRTRFTLTEQRSRNEITRLVCAVNELRARFAGRGPFLVGNWSIADAFLTPEAARLRSYGIDLAAFGDEGPAAAYFGSLLEAPDYLEWEKLARTGA